MDHRRHDRRCRREVDALINVRLAGGDGADLHTTRTARAPPGLLRTFLAVVRSRNITRAAEQIHLAQSGVGRRARTHFFLGETCGDKKRAVVPVDTCFPGRFRAKPAIRHRREIVLILKGFHEGKTGAARQD
ncbi:helix-turn-helix domain-containing protein [Bradyrhizobium lablabi]|uniref:helix-turn-helix domain-containing protein n=1 Tax=Bradyrhizobium lablabi TaxID=722472 RepID=UPI0009A848B4|nr:LysR family transcriptional regulator [Bradyrhizobium lablabi]